MTDLLFRNNTNTADQLSVCLNLVQTSPTHILISNSTFQGNNAVYSTVAVISGAKSFTFQSVTCTGNTAISTSAGIIFTPLVTEDSSINVRDCVFSNNSALRSGLIFIQENTGLMFASSSHVTATLSNSTFSNNKSSYSGCSLTISGFVVLSSQSVVTGNSFLNNTCGEGGSALYVGYEAGVITVDGNIFSGNLGNSGTAIYSTHQGSPDKSTYMLIQDCVFFDNQGVSIVQISGIQNPLLITRNNTFDSNAGTCIGLQAAIWTDSTSVYLHNNGLEGGVLEALDYSQVIIVDFRAENNFASIKGGVASITGHSTVSCTNCVFMNNTSADTGGVISMDQQSMFNCSNSDFSLNEAGTVGSVVYSLFSTISISYSTITHNFALQYGTISLTESNFLMSFSEMNSNTASSRSAGIISITSNVTLTTCTIRNQTGVTGGVFFTPLASLVTIDNSTFTDCHATSGGVFYSMAFTIITVHRSSFTECSATSDSSLAQVRGATMILDDVSISNMTTVLSSGALYMIQSVLRVENSWIADLRGSAIVAQTSTVVITNSTLTRLVAVYGSGVNCADCTCLNVSSSVFTDNLSKLGGVIYSFTAGFMENVLTSAYIGNTFANNRALNGGAIYSNSIDINMTENTFRNNSVSHTAYVSQGMLITGVGGAVYSVCTNVPACAFNIQSNRFEQNSAEVKGGAIYWFDDFPQIQGNQMTGNVAAYGNDIASFAIRLVMVNATNAIESYLSNDTVPLVGKLTDVGSGHVSDEVVQLALLDHYGNIVSCDSSSAAQITYNKSLISVSGTTQVAALAGIFTFSQLVFTGQPSTNQKFIISTTGVDTRLKSYTGDPNSYYPSVTVAVDFRECLMGESLQNGECYSCAAGTFSLNPSEPCNSCPNEVTCYGNYTMVPNPGYWRPDPALNLFFPCPYLEACLGSPPNLLPVSLTGTCADGYSGNLCSTCLKGYSRTGKDQCGQCPGLTANIAVSTLIVIVSLTLGAIIIIVAIRGASRPRSELAIHIKIFMNYLQMVVVAASLNLNWPNFVALFLNEQNTAGSVSDQLFSYDCIMQELEIQQIYYTKMAGAAVLPAALVLLALLAWIVISMCARIELLLQKLVASLVMIIFILHPSLSKEMFSMFSCMQLKPDELWIISDMSLRCWSADHTKYILMVSVPSIALWIFGLPMICFFVLFKSRKTLSNLLTQLKFSFLYKGYHPEWYYWEFVILYRKVALVCASVFLTTVSIMVQALSVLAVLLIALFFQLQVKPFVSAVFNHLELKSIMVSAVTIYSGLFYQTESITNAYFLLSWLKCVLPLLYGVLRRKLAKGVKRYQPNVFKTGTQEDMGDFSGTSKATHEVRPDQDQSDCSEMQSRVTPINVPENTPHVLEAEYSVAEYEEKTNLSPTIH